MGFARQPVLVPEIEERLKEEMRPLWNGGALARDIASKLNFGVKVEGNPYSKLKVRHVWFYRFKFGFRKRKGGIKKGRPRYKKKLEEPMQFKEFQATLDKRIPHVPTDYARRKRAYLILHYWTPLRRSEILERVAKDFSIKHDVLKINLYRKKKYYREGEKKEPFYLSLRMPLVDEVVDWVTRFEDDERPFSFSGWTGWNYVREVFEGYYPHFFRFDYITKAIENAEDVKTIVIELLNDTGLDLATITTYVMANPKHRTSINERELASLQHSGIALPVK